MIFQIIILIILIGLSAFFSAAETSLISLSQLKVRTLLKKQVKGAETLYRLKQNPHKIIITVLIGNNLVNTCAASLATFMAIRLFGSTGVGIATGVMTFLLLVLGDITPKTFASQNAVKMALFSSKIIEWMSFILMPFIKAFEFISKVLLKILGSKTEEKISQEELKTIVTMGKEQGILEEKTAEILHNVLEFQKTKAKEVMTPKLHVIMVNGNQKLKSIIGFVIKNSYTKYPVYLNNKNKIIGILDVDDVLKYVKNKNLEVKIKTMVRKAYFVKESKEISELLSELSSKKTPAAVVLDKNNNFMGLVTLEDILEEIVGDIFDKSKKNKKYIQELNKNITPVNAKISVQELNKILNLDLKEGKTQTIAGFIEHKLKRTPKKGERIIFRGNIIEIDKVTNQGIKSIKIIKSSH